ncbi:hypothetical protein Rrhod_2872 [Rhodococcus rhodnii LMG 5362]|uniref:Uncharacterized protein n=2 Tax=Rhodococcus rhodnii TaxID=38312 RepID=R7WPB3_9NOCA|nr:hypothetical protein Rrhod_2872 [Rhodococcus rhodnii LMG 5362]
MVWPCTAVRVPRRGDLPDGGASEPATTPADDES